MAFSIETNSATERQLRRGFFDTLDEAKRALLDEDQPERVAAAVYEGHTTSGGAVVAVFDTDHGWIDVESVSRPHWWDHVPGEVREWLVSNPGGALPSWVWVPVVQSGGSAYTVQWDGGDPSGMNLTLADEEWLRFRRGLSDSQA